MKQVEIDAQDFGYNKKTGKLELMHAHHTKVYNTCLAEKLVLGGNTRIMLTKNMNVIDGLINEVCALSC